MKENKIGNIIFLGKKRKTKVKNTFKNPEKKNSVSEIQNIRNKNISTAKTIKKIENTCIQLSLIKRTNKSKNNINKNNLFKFEESNIIFGTEEDFKNPIAFFDKLLQKKDTYSGVIKVIPPRTWKKNYDRLFEKYYKKRFLEKDTKMEIRMQILNNLLLGKVIH